MRRVITARHRWCPRQDSNLRSRLRRPVDLVIARVFQRPAWAFCSRPVSLMAPFVLWFVPRDIPRRVSSVDEFEALVLGEVGVVLDVERREQEFAGEAADGNPRVVDRSGDPRSRAWAWILPQPVAAWKLRGRTTLARRPAGQRGVVVPTGCRQDHWVSSPTVAKVITSCRPASRQARASGSCPLTIAEATSVVDDDVAHGRPARREASRSARKAAVANVLPRHGRLSLQFSPSAVRGGPAVRDGRRWCGPGPCRDVPWCPGRSRT